MYSVFYVETFLVGVNMNKDIFFIYLLYMHLEKSCQRVKNCLKCHVWGCPLAAWKAVTRSLRLAIRKTSLYHSKHTKAVILRLLVLFPLKWVSS